MSQTSLPIYDSAAVKLRSLLELKALIRYRFLVRNLVARDLKVRYKRSALGFLWVTLNPLLTMLVIALVFSRIIKFTTQDHYLTFLLSGILLWNLYAQGSIAAMSSLLGNSPILRRMYVPPSTFVAAAIGSALVNFILALGPLYGVALLNGAPFRLSWLLVLIPCLETALFTFGIGLVLSVMMIFFTDTFEIYTVLINLYMYLTPIYYPLSLLPRPLQQLENYNPMYLYISSFQAAMLTGNIPLTQTLLGAAMAGAMFLGGWLVFTRLEKSFAYHF